MLEQLHDSLWVADAPHRFLGLALGSRMTVVRQANGDLLVYSPIALTDGLRGELEDLGPVRTIVAPNLYHHVYAGQYAEVFGDAALYGAEGLGQKRKDLRLTAELTDASATPWADELPSLTIAGSMLRETVLLHKPSRTLISCDLTENFRECDHWMTRQYLKVMGIYRKPGLAKALRITVRDKPATRQSIETLLRWDFDRIVVAHGSVVDTDGREILRDTYAWLP